jgi:signal transduction histidine kinase
MTKAPAWATSVRARLAVMYSLVLFVLMAVVLTVVYVGVRADIADEPVTSTLKIAGRKLDGSQLLVQEAGEYTLFEQVVSDRTLDVLRNASAIGLGAMGLLSLLIGWVLAGRALRPVSEVTDVAARIEATDLSRRIALSGPDDELRRLADTFDRMLDRLDAAFAAQHQLVDDASHELRNPLAVMRTNLDVALRDKAAGVGQLRQTVIVTSRAVDRLARQVDDLLSSARRADVRLDDSDVDLAAVLRETAEEFEAASRLRQLSLVVEAPDAVSTTADRDALKRAVGNLLDNAVRLAPAGTNVLLTAGAEGGWRWLAVRDEGPGIGKEQQKYVFERLGPRTAPADSGWRSSGRSSRRTAGPSTCTVLPELDRPSCCGCPLALRPERAASPGRSRHTTRCLHGSP